MNLSDLVKPEGVIPNLKARSKKQALHELAAQASKLTGIKSQTILEKLLDREKLGTTGVGQGIAIPHGKFEELDHVVGLFARLKKPVDFESIDDQPVDLIFLLLAPDPAGAAHLKALARVSRLFRDQSICEKIRGTDNADALHAMLSEGAAPHAA